MQLLIDIPDEIAEELSQEEPNLAHRILEGFAVDGYRQGSLTGLQVRRILSLETRFDLERLLQRARIIHQTMDDEVEEEIHGHHSASHT
jgi:hypothetical protein